MMLLPSMFQVTGNSKGMEGLTTQTCNCPFPLTRHMFPQKIRLGHMKETSKFPRNGELEETSLTDSDSKASTVPSIST